VLLYKTFHGVAPRSKGWFVEHPSLYPVEQRLSSLVAAEGCALAIWSLLFSRGRSTIRLAVRAGSERDYGLQKRLKNTLSRPPFLMNQKWPFSCRVNQLYVLAQRRKSNGDCNLRGGLFS
ncbi:MAG: hypothetical protein ACR2FY_06725, partial [Pirellulaceae bacterium]